MSTAIPLLVVIALVAAIALCGVGIWAAIELAKASRSSRRLVEDMDDRLPPLADKLDVTVDAMNAELLRVDLIVNQLEGAVDRITGTAETVREVVDAPIHLVNEVADRVRHGFRRRGGQPKRASRQEPGTEQHPDVVLVDISATENDFPEADRLAEFEHDIVEAPSVVEVDGAQGSDDEPEAARSEDEVPTPESPDDLGSHSARPENHEPEEA